MKSRELAAELFTAAEILSQSQRHSADYIRDLLAGEENKDWSFAHFAFQWRRCPLVNRSLVSNGAILLNCGWNIYYWCIRHEFSLRPGEAEDGQKHITLEQVACGFDPGERYVVTADGTVLKAVHETRADHPKWTLGDHGGLVANLYPHLRLKNEHVRIDADGEMEDKRLEKILEVVRWYVAAASQE